MCRAQTRAPAPEALRNLAAAETHFNRDAFTAKQAATVGIRPRQLSALVREGLLRSDVRGVYQVGPEPADLTARARAAALALPPGGAIGRRTAAWVHGVDLRAPQERDQPMDVECLVPLAATPMRRPAIRCFRTDLEPGDLTEIAGIPLTTPTRTVADILRWCDPPMGLAGADALVRQETMDPDEVIAVLDRWPGFRFVGRARRLASWIDPLSESFGESWLRLRILEAGFPRPTAQIPILDDRGRLVYRLDLGWPEYRIGIEYDGREFHSSRASLVADERRRSDLSSRFGWHVVGVGLGEVFGRSLTLERGVGELLGLEPQITRRTW